MPDDDDEAGRLPRVIAYPIIAVLALLCWAVLLAPVYLLGVL